MINLPIGAKIIMKKSGNHYINEDLLDMTTIHADKGQIASITDIRIRTHGPCILELRLDGTQKRCYVYNYRNEDHNSWRPLTPLEQLAAECARSDKQVS